LFNKVELSNELGISIVFIVETYKTLLIQFDMAKVIFDIEIHHGGPLRS